MSIFSQNRATRRRLNKFDKSHERKLTFNMGSLVPFMNEEIVPGDKFKVMSEVFLRLAPMIAPIMHRVDLRTYYFFVPNRLVWEDWESFITGGTTGNETPIWPHVSMNNLNKAYFRKGALPDYMGLPIMDPDVAYTGSGIGISALQLRAYQLIYNEYFIDQNIQVPYEFSKASGEITDLEEINQLSFLRKKAWDKDYFTSALPWAQRGNEATLPLGTVEPNYKDVAQWNDFAGNSPGSLDAENATGNINVGGVTGRIDNLDTMEVDATTINDLRKAITLQQWLEKSARAGSRYTEQILAFFGVHSKDQRLQRPEFLGGGSSPIQISEVLQNSSSGFESGPVSETPQGNMAGHGIGVGTGHGFNGRFTEHGNVIGIMVAQPKGAYQDGIDRQWTRQDKFDYFWPEFANLGEQEITNKEIFADFNDSGGVNHDTFGYQSRYAEYKYGKSSVHGDFRDELRYWHLGRVFDNLPTLNSTFIQSDPREDIFAITDPDEHKLYCQVFNRVNTLRPMPYFGTPGVKSI